MKKLKAGKNPPKEINVFIEIPEGGDIKYELNKDTGIVFVDRFLFTAFSYPFNYGFVPDTLAEDGDPIDVLVLSSRSVLPGTVLPSKPIGMLEMEDEEGIDTKIIAVPIEKIDPFYGTWNSIDDVPDTLKKKIKHFFEHYKELEQNKWVKIKDWKGKSAAEADIKKCLNNNL